MTAPEQRVPRLLAMVPYFLARPGISTAEAAADFGITEKQLIKDLELLWVCGLPGHGPGDLIDLSYEGGTVSIIFDAGMSRPLRLTAEEALVLVVALRTLAEMPGAASSDAIQRALAKVEAAAGGAVADSTVAIELDAIQKLQPVLRRALAEKRALAMRYFAAGRNETTERTVDPLRLFEADGRSYLEAWCRSAEGVRVFRVDRIEDVRLLDEPAAPPAEVQLRDLAEGVFRPAAEHLLVELALSPAYGWVAEYYPVESAEEAGSGEVHISLRVSEPAWVQGLVLGSGGEVRVLSPGWLADATREDAAAALAAYSAK